MLLPPPGAAPTPAAEQDDLLTPVQMSAILRTAVKAAGTEAAFARQHGLRRQELNDATTGRRPPSLAVLAAIDLMPVQRFIRRRRGR